MRFLHRCPDAVANCETNIYSNAPYCLGRWQHMVAVKQAESMTLYINGKVVGSGSDPTLFQNKPRRLIVGKLAECPDVQTPRYFHGWLDELAVYTKALSPLEVEKHHQLARESTNPT